MQIAALPYLDEYTTVITAEADDIWRTLGEAVDRSFSRRGMAGYAKLAGADPCTVSGPRPFEEGSTVPGFRVVAVDPGRELVLKGTHRFSSYAVLFQLEQAGPGQSRLRAESRGSFTGMVGGLYRRAVIGTGGHGIAVRRMLADIRRRSERHTSASGPGQDSPS